MTGSATRIMRGGALCAIVAIVSGCAFFQGLGQRAQQSKDVPPAPPVAGQEIFQSYCVDCHGPSGQGDGRLAQDLAVPPADLSTLRLRNDGVFPAEHAMAQIHGYPGKFHRGLMPEFGPILAGPVVEWTTAEGKTIVTPRALLDLVTYIESLQQ